MTNLNFLPSKHTIQFAIPGACEVNWSLYPYVFRALFPLLPIQPLLRDS